MPASESEPQDRAPQDRVPHVSPLRHGLVPPHIHHVLLYDGVCGLCQRTVRWMLRHDPDGRLLFAAQQQPLAAEVFARHGLDRQQINCAVLVSNFGKPEERLAIRSDAILSCLTVLGGRWAALAVVARIVPRALRDAAYRWLARHRIGLFGAAELCAMPTPAERARFLGV